jgi:hypothetical protein
MKSRAKYFDKYGTEISADDAFDRHGALRNGFAMRVPITMRDSMRGRDAKPQFSDGSSIVDPASGLKTGWRMPVVQDRRAVHDAYARYQTELINAYRVGDIDERGEGKSLFGSGNEGRCPDPASDSRQVMDHHQRMSELYDTHDRELANAWRGR